MKKVVAIFVFTMIVYFLYSNTKENKTSFSPESLNETLLDLNKNQVPFSKILDKHLGKVTVIEVWASWCGDCVKSLPDLKELQKTHTEVNYVFISMDKNVNSWKYGIERHKLKGDHYMAKDQMSGVFAKAIDLDWVPRYIIIDKTGKIVLYRAIEKDFNLINKKLTELK